MRLLVRLCCLATLAAPLTSAASQETYDTPHLPPDAYQYVVIPDDGPQQQPPPPPPPAQSPQAEQEPQDDPEVAVEEDGSGCPGFGCPPTEIDVANQLLRSGPSTTETYAGFDNVRHQFAVVGFVQEGWPLSVEYAAEPGTVTVLRIKLYHRRKLLIVPFPFYEVAFQANLDALPAESEGANSWHRTVKVPAITLSREADPIASSGLHVARYDIRSYRLVDGQIDRRQRVPVQVLGLTVGPQVVGSLSLLGAGFERRTAQIPAQGAPPLALRFGYRTDRIYDLLHDTIEVYDDDALTYRFDRQVGSPHSAGPAQPFSRVWQVTRRQKPGKYRALVKGWWNCRGTSFTASMQSCPNNPNWAVATSSDIVLTQ